MNSNVLYHVIYSLDVFKDNYKTISDCKVNMLKKTSLFTVTEDYNENPGYYKAHRKYCSLLTAAQTEQFLFEIGAVDTCETMGGLYFTDFNR